MLFGVWNITYSGLSFCGDVYHNCLQCYSISLL